MSTRQMNCWSELSLCGSYWRIFTFANGTAYISPDLATRDHKVSSENLFQIFSYCWALILWHKHWMYNCRQYPLWPILSKCVSLLFLLQNFDFYIPDKIPMSVLQFLSPAYLPKIYILEVRGFCKLDDWFGRVLSFCCSFDMKIEHNYHWFIRTGKLLACRVAKKKFFQRFDTCQNLRNWRYAISVRMCQTC